VNEGTREIVDAAVSVHTRLGPGLFEPVYEAVLGQAVELRGSSVRREMPVPLVDGLRFEEAFRIDLQVDQRVVVELKSIEQLAPVHTKQVLTYLRLTDLRVGLLVDFGGATLRRGSVASSTAMPPDPFSRFLCVRPAVAAARGARGTFPPGTRVVGA